MVYFDSVIDDIIV